MTEVQFWGVFLSGFVGGAGAMVVIYSWLRDRRSEPQNGER